MISRVSHSLALKRQLLQSSRGTKNVVSRHCIPNGHHDRVLFRQLAPSTRFFSSSLPSNRAPLFEAMGSKLDKLIQDSQWLIPRKGTGEWVGDTEAKRPGFAKVMQTEPLFL